MNNLSDYKKNLSEPWFSKVYDGEKIIEGRLNKKSFSIMNVGDTITWYNNENNNYKEFKTVIMKVKKYNCFYELINVEGLNNVLPHESIKTIEDGLEVYNSFYKKEDEEKYGVISFKLKLI